MDTPIGQFVLIGNFRRRLARELLVPVLAFLGFHLGRRVATAFKSVRMSIRVSLLVRAQRDAAEWPVWTRRAQSGRSRLRPKSFAKTC